MHKFQFRNSRSSLAARGSEARDAFLPVPDSSWWTFENPRALEQWQELHGAWALCWMFASWKHQFSVIGTWFLFLFFSNFLTVVNIYNIKLIVVTNFKCTV